MAIRDITAHSYYYTYQQGFPSGAFRTTINRSNALSAGKEAGYNYGDLYLDANISTQGGVEIVNPMAGHANGKDIHPYSIYMVPLITY